MPGSLVLLSSAEFERGHYKYFAALDARRDRTSRALHCKDEKTMRKAGGMGGWSVRWTIERVLHKNVYSRLANQK